jgi:hypothetical protein
MMDAKNVHRPGAVTIKLLLYFVDHLRFPSVMKHHNNVIIGRLKVIAISNLTTNSSPSFVEERSAGGADRRASIVC